ncbi:molecular chaperone [Enemella evansiae]|uniref:Hsp70 family protein n=1 Tax=Enemella evansiae TaxID=2016499 RepID=UPI000B97C832|nr:Hsp70 family protein [Enemella evansiae]OYN93388.1 molecular chaperone [Enemella evansiae]
MTHIGIDLGTTYSCVVRHEGNGRDVVVPSWEGKELTPSVVYFDPDGSVLVGEDARDRLKDDRDNVVVGIKRHLGRDYLLGFHGQTYTPEAISAVILRRLAADAADFLSVDTRKLRAVVTVPAYFGAAEKEATYTAARLAGLECLELLAEPVAAAYAYGAEPQTSESSVVFDLGGGTFDVAVIGSERGVPKIWAVGGETKLGGLDWDERLNDILWEALNARMIPEEATWDDDFLAKVKAEAELVKRQLTGRESVTSRFRYAGETYAVSTSRRVFESATRDLVSHCLHTVERVMQTSTELGAAPMARVLLVGGSTRMPMIREALKKLGVPVLIHDPDKAVARGAALLASRLSAPRLGRVPAQAGRLGPVDHRISTVAPRGIGIKIHSSRLPGRSEPYILNIIPPNEPLPVRDREFTVATIVDDQEKARIELFEQAGAELSEVIEDNRPLLDSEIVKIPPARAGSPIALLISISDDGRLDEVKALFGAARTPLTVAAFIHGVVDDAEFSEQETVVCALHLQG